MSAGRFTKTFYQAQYDTAKIYKCRVQPETLLADIAGTTNDPGGTAATEPFSATISTNKRRKGIRMRGLALKFPDTGQPTGYAPGGIIVIPALTPAFFLAASLNNSITYLSTVCEISYLINEQVN